MADENASNPLAAVNNTDLRYQYTTDSSQFRKDLFIDGAYMLNPRLKLKYELHYNSTDATGTTNSDFEKVLLKAIYFPSDRQLGEAWGMRTALGVEWVAEFGNSAQGIGIGADQIGPFGGVALSNRDSGLTLVPLIQHNESYSGPTDVSVTALRLIAIQPFAERYWFKLDARAPYDWNNSQWSGTAEFQLGFNIKPGRAVYFDALAGLGKHRSFDWGLGAGLRFNY